VCLFPPLVKKEYVFHGEFSTGERISQFESWLLG